MKNLITLLLGALICWPLHARVIQVPEHARTIQAALNMLGTNDTILVASGTYEEALLAPALQFYLLGTLAPEFGEDSLPTVLTTGVTGPDTLSSLELPRLSSPVIRNLKFKNTGRRGIRSSAADVVLYNCILDSVRTGFRHAPDSLFSTIVLERCVFRGNVLDCVLIKPGNLLIATACRFEGREGGYSPLVASSHSRMDSCIFAANPGRYLLTAVRGPHSITNCTFGPFRTPNHEGSILLGDGPLVLSGNLFTDFDYGAHVVTVQSNAGDSVEICDNTFVRCRNLPDMLSPVGVIDVYTTGAAERGPLICGNTFMNCSGFRYADALSLGPFAPALVTENCFIHDSLNGVPSVAMSPNSSQPTPATLRDNIFEGCGYALSGLGSADARFNYWGSNTGPYHETENPFGTGDTVTGDIPFIPWLNDTTGEAAPEPPAVVNELELSVFPNPFNPTTTLFFSLPSASTVVLVVHDVRGREVLRQALGRYTVGTHDVLLDGSHWASGLYFASLHANHSHRVIKLALVK